MSLADCTTFATPCITGKLRGIRVDEYLCLNLLSRLGESEADCKGRLSALWTAMLRQHPDDFEKVYAETSAFEKSTDRLLRKYLVEAAAIPAIVAKLKTHGMDHEPVDEDEVYSKFEA